MFKRFCRDRAGSFAVWFVTAFPVIIGAVGLSIDVTNLIAARSGLRTALDAATLASSRLSEKNQSRQEVFQAYFTANIAGNPSLKNAKATLSIDETAVSIRSSGLATADVNLHFAWLFGVQKRVSADAVAYEANNALEVVLVLDNTGSMAGARIAALRNATTELLKMLETVQSPTRTVKVSMVPFVTAVNIKGDGFKMSWIDQLGTASLNGANFAGKPSHLDLFSTLGVAWKGCVEARPGTLNISDEAPSAAKPDTLFVPYLAPDDPGIARPPSSSYGNSSTGFNNSYLDDMVSGTDMDIIRSKGKYTSSSSKQINEAGPLTVGPNRACPTPVVPLTSDFVKLQKAADAMKEWNGSGTNVSEGLTWGMRMLSPGEPFTEGQPFKTPGVSKAVLLLTDGENVVYGASNQVTKSDYGAYGYLASGRFGSDNQGTAARNVDDWVLSVCDSLKKNEVQIYTVLLQADTAANRKLYSACASSPSNYYPTNDVSQLEAVFRTIGRTITQLHLTN